MKNNTIVALIIISGAVNACGGGSSGPVDQNSGACVVNYAQPVLSISTAVDSITAAQVASVTISNVALNGAPANLSSIVEVARNITVAGNTLVCQLPCGFSNTEGEYTFTVKASGYKDLNQRIIASYPTFVGGCPATYSGTTAISLRLDPL